MGEVQQYPCRNCFRVLVAYELSDYAANQTVATSAEAHYGCHVMATNLSRKLYTGITQKRVRRMITSLRVEYLDFRKFLKLPGVTYDSINDEIEIDEEYNRTHLNEETALERNYRDNGFPLWDHLHEAFKKRRFPNFPRDTPDLFVDPDVYSDSDEA